MNDITQGPKVRELAKYPNAHISRGQEVSQSHMIANNNRKYVQKYDFVSPWIVDLVSWAIDAECASVCDWC